MKINFSNSSFTLVRANRVSDYQLINSAIEKARFIRNNHRNTYQFHNGGYVAELFTYTIVDNEDGFVLNRKPLTYNECITLIKMYC